MNVQSQTTHGAGRTEVRVAGRWVVVDHGGVAVLVERKSAQAIGWGLATREGVTTTTLTLTHQDGVSHLSRGQETVVLPETAREEVAALLLSLR